MADYLVRAGSDHRAANLSHAHDLAATASRADGLALVLLATAGVELLVVRHEAGRLVYERPPGH